MPSALTAPVDYLGAVGQAKKHSEKVIDTAALNQTIMLFNAQADEPTVQRLVKLARAEKIPVVAITETEPAGKTYQAWMLAQLEALDKALAGVTQ